MSQDPTEFIEGEVSGGDSDEADDGDTSEIGEVEAVDETGTANPDSGESSVGE